MSRMNEAVYRAAEQQLFNHYGVTVREHTINVGNPTASIRVLELGEGDPILFIHGSPNDAATWVPLVAQLPNRRCLLVERPGAGLSAPIKRWSDHRAISTAIVAAVLADFDLEQVDLVGSSLGGLYAYNFAIAHPQRVRHLIQIGAPAGPAALPTPPVIRFLSLPLPSLLLKKALRPDTEGARKMFTEIGHTATVDAGSIPDIVFQWYSALLCHTDTLEHLSHEVRAIASPLGYRKQAKLPDAALAEIEVPSLYLWGNDDSFAKPSHGDALAALTPGAAIAHFDDFGHILWYDDPTLVADRVEAFLATDRPLAREASA